MKNTKSLFEKIMRFFRESGRMPSYTELMKITGYKSKSAVKYFVDKLVEEDLITRDKTGRLIPKNPFGGIRLLGVVEAGWPSPAEEELVDTMSLDDYLIENREATYLLKVKGDSMIDAGIQEGDLVVAERINVPKIGKIVVAEVDGEWTMKYLRKDKKGNMFLEPANNKYKPIYPKGFLSIMAEVRGVIRKY